MEPLNSITPTMGENSLQKEVKYIFKNLTALDIVIMIDDYALWHYWCDRNSMIEFLENNSSYLALDYDAVTCIPFQS